MPTNTINQLPVYSSVPANLGAVTCTTQSVQYTVGFSNGPGSTTLSAASALGATSVTVASATSFYQGECVLIDGGLSTAELAIITNITSTTFTVQRFDGAPGLQQAHISGANIVGTSAALMPTFQGRVDIEVEGTLQGNTSNDGISVQIVAIPAKGAAGPAAGTALAGVTGAVPVGNTIALLATANTPAGFALGATLGAAGATNTTPSGGAALTAGIPYIFDLLVADTSVAGHTVTAKSVVWSIGEF